MAQALQPPLSCSRVYPPSLSKGQALKTPSRTGCSSYTVACHAHFNTKNSNFSRDFGSYFVCPPRVATCSRTSQNNHAFCIGTFFMLGVFLEGACTTQVLNLDLNKVLEAQDLGSSCVFNYTMGVQVCAHLPLSLSASLLLPLVI